MHRWLRLITASMLLLALPLQGYAAAAMIHCGPNHASHQALFAAPAHDTGNGAAHHAEHGHAAAVHAAPAADDEAAGGAGQSAQAVPPAVPQDAANHPGAGALPDAAGGTCSVCAACCSASVIASTPMQLPVIAATPSYTVAQLALYTGETPARIERPPRQVLA